MSAPAGGLRALDLRPGERSSLLQSSLLAMLAVADAVLIRTFSDAIFLDRFPAERLALFYLISALVFLPATMAYSALSRRLPPRVLHGAMPPFFGLLCGAAFFLPSSPVAAFGLVLGLAIVSPLVNVATWSSILSSMDQRQARRLVPLVSAGATFGGVLGGVGALPYIHWVGVPEMLFLIAAINLLLGTLILARARSGEGEPESDDTESPAASPGKPRPATSGSWRTLLRQPLVLLLAATVTLMSLCTNLTDYAFKSQLQASVAPAADAVSGAGSSEGAAPARLSGGRRLEGLGIYLGAFNSVTNILILLVQLLLVTRVVRKLGLQRAFALHPLVTLLGLGAFVAWPGMAAVALWKLGDVLFKFTFQSPTLEMALMPVRREERDSARALFKGVMHPLGGFAAGGLLAVAAPLGLAPKALVLPAVLFAGGAWLVLSLRLKHPYRDSLQAALAQTESVAILPAVAPRSEPAAPSPAALSASSRSVSDPPRTRTGVIRELDGAVHDLRRMHSGVAQRPNSEGDLRAAVDRLFELLQLLGEPSTVDLIRRRYQYGTLATKALAVELLEAHLDERRANEAVALLDSLAPELLDLATRTRRAREQQRGAGWLGRLFGRRTR